MNRLLLIALSVMLTSCVVHRLAINEVDVTEGTPFEVSSPVKAHLHDGSTVVFANGISVANNEISGNGKHHDFTLNNSTTVTTVSLDDIAAIETYQTPVSTGATGAASAGAGVGIVIGAAVLALALFGSCPTVYSFDGTEAMLEAETFSYSIAPSFQSRDIDRLGLQASATNLLELELRNEMLETHYIDQMQILEITHAANETVYPNHKGKPLVVGQTIEPAKASDQSGRNILPAIRSADGEAWKASDDRLQNVHTDDLMDHLDVEFDVVEGEDDIALVLRMRNSLLTTVLFYDVMLKQQNFYALDWLGKDLNSFVNKLDVGLWYRQQMGLTVSVWKNGRYHKVAKIGDQGPIAWSERAVKLPSHGSGRLKVRLSFVADSWRIDQIAAATRVRHGRSRAIAVSDVKGPNGSRDDIPKFLENADKEYLITKPRDRLKLSFDVGPGAEDQLRTYFLKSEGYYIEWMRTDWLTHEKRQAFVPGDDAIMQAITIWRNTRETMRMQFDSTKLAVR